MSISCHLCALPCPSTPITEEEMPFCCQGCLVVFRVLQSQGYSGDFQAHPLVQELVATQEGVQEGGEEARVIHFEIGEMWCPSCALAIRLILERVKGVELCVVDYATDLAKVRYNPRHISQEQIFARITRMGYAPAPFLDEEKKPARALWVRFGTAAFIALNMMMFALPLYTSHPTEGYNRAVAWLCFGLSIPLLSYASWPIWKRFWLGVRTGVFGMETLVLIAASTAFVTSVYHLFHQSYAHLYFDSMSMLLTFVLLGKLLERRAKFSAKQSLFRLTRTLPKKGLKQFGNHYRSVPLKEIEVGDTLLIRTGEKVVLDGVVTKGEGVVDASIMTGEALPRTARPGSKVIGGTILKQGSLHIEVSADVSETMLAKISLLLEEDLARKQSAARLIDRLIPYFVPAVIVLAAAAYPFGGLLRSLSVLLISCPCAIGIAAPLAEARTLFKLAEKGALVRNRACLPLLAKNPLFAFDKTGTLTHGKFTVTEGLENLSAHDKTILKGLTSHTTHPLAQAIGSELPTAVEIESVKETIGRGIEGSYKGSRYLMGSSAFMQERGIDATSSTTTVHFAKNTQLLTSMTLADQLRSDIPRVDGVILSGDSAELVASIAKQCGFRWGKGECTPLQKRDEIQKLPKPVAMVGDGVNDAPALSAADIGISVVSATDVSIACSDILLTKEHLSLLPNLISIAKRGQRILKQNIFWAFIYNGVGIALALSGALTPLFAVTAMVLSSLCVVANSMRA